jgi:hypothetical protein
VCADPKKSPEISSSAVDRVAALRHRGMSSTAAPISITVSKVIAASPDHLYDTVADITNMARLSPETVETAWLGGATVAAPGVRFKGKNKLGKASWSTKPTVTSADPGAMFSFKVPGAAGAQWTYLFEPVDGGTRVTESVRQDKPSSAIIRFIQRRNGVTDRASHLRAGMTETLDRLAALTTN